MLYRSMEVAGYIPSYELQSPLSKSRSVLAPKKHVHLILAYAMTSDAMTQIKNALTPTKLPPRFKELHGISIMCYS